MKKILCLLLGVSFLMTACNVEQEVVEEGEVLENEQNQQIEEMNFGPNPGDG